MKDFLLLLIFTLISGACAAGDFGVQVDASFVKSQSEAYLYFNLKNNSGVNIEVYKSLLPWENANSISMVAYIKNNITTEIYQVFPISDPFFSDRVIVKNGSALNGKIRLSKFFPSLNKSLKENDVLLFWSYFMILANRDASKYFSGVVVIPRDLVQSN